MKVNNQKSIAQAYAVMNDKAAKSANAITESWAPMITRTTGVKDPEKLAWMSELAHNTAKAINEDQQQLMGNNPASAFGNVYSPYNTLYNTLGIGNPVPAGKPAMTASDYATDAFNGSGDKYPALLPLAMKVAAKTIGFELVNTTPLAGPTGVLPYMDYVYSGSKQPYGATPAFGPANANPARLNQAHYSETEPHDFKAYHLYGLPNAFKAILVVTDSETSTHEHAGKVLEAKRALLEAGLKAGVVLKSDNLTVEFAGWSRIDGDPIFKVIEGKMSLGQVFENGAVEFKGNGVSMSLNYPRLVSMLEDSILGFAGAGELDSDAWAGTYQDGTVLYDPMSRGTGELTPARQISLQLFTKNITVGTIQVACAVTQEQVTDLQKQWGIDVVKMVENAGVNELSQTINRHICSRLFALGWKNHVKMVEVEGPAACLNMGFVADAKDTLAYAMPCGKFDEAANDYNKYENVSLPILPFNVIEGAQFENRDTLIKRIFTNILAASNWIQQRGRQGAATFVVTNIRVATLLQSDAHYTFSPIENTIKQTAGQLYPIGTVCGLTVYVDPLMAAGDTRVLVGRKGGKDEPGVHFCPYVMADVVRTIAEGTMAPKIMIKSRYALVDAGFFPETQYLTFFVDCRGL